MEDPEIIIFSPLIAFGGTFGLLAFLAALYELVKLLIN